jgi:putative sugar O-methyltransferase
LTRCGEISGALYFACFTLCSRWSFPQGCFSNAGAWDYVITSTGFGATEGAGRPWFFVSSATRSFLDNLPNVHDGALKVMLSDLASGPNIYHPSEFWVHFLTKNLIQLEEDGIENFKQTVNQNYFNWTAHHIEPQFEKILAGIDPSTRTLVDECLNRSEDVASDYSCLTREQWIAYKKFVVLFWEYTLKEDKLGLLFELNEPSLGNPFTFDYKGHKISQDICNSVLELNSLAEGMGNNLPKANVLELGGGYGRNADVLLRSYPDTIVTMVDIPPALQICEWYLAQLHSERKIFRYRPFGAYEEIETEFEQSSVRFLLPHQLEMIPDKSFTACINISSLHEMTLDQIKHWFNMFDRLVGGCFYTKQWIKSYNPFDGIEIERHLYPVKSSWKEHYNRVCSVQEKFFEALYQI